MATKEKVYKAFAELIYSVVMADGEISEREKASIARIVNEHPIGTTIQEYIGGERKDISIVQSFLHTMDVCKEHGQDNEYSFLIDLTEQIAKVSEGMDDDGLLVEFVSSFKRKFHLN